MTATNEDLKLIQQFLEQLGTEIRANVPKVTGATADSVQVEMYSDGGSLVGSEYIFVLEHGRGPTKVPKGTVSSDGPLWKHLLKWAEAKGIQPKNDGTLKQMAFAMANKMHMFGDDKFERGIKTGVISNVITDKRIDAFVSAFSHNTFKLMVEENEELKKIIEQRNASIVRL